MAIQLLDELNERLAAAGAAGVALAGEDFRLQQLAEKVKAMEKVPVFATISKLLQELIAGEERSRAFSELVNLVQAVRVTQAEAVAAAGFPLAASAEAVFVENLRFSEMSEVKSAMTATGSGRMEIMQRAERRGILRDVRFADALAEGIRSSYSEMADICRDYALLMGAPAIPALKAALLSGNGKAADARVLKVLARIAGANENALYLKYADKAAGELQIEAVKALTYDPSNEALLKERVEGKTGKKLKQYYAAALLAMPGRAAKGLGWSLFTQEQYYVYTDVLSHDLPYEANAFLAQRLSELIDGLIESKKEEKTENAFRIGLVTHVMLEQSDPAAYIQVCRKALELRDRLEGCEVKLDGWSEYLLQKCANALAVCNRKEENEYLVELRKTYRNDELTSAQFVAYFNLTGGKGAYSEFSRELSKPKSDGAAYICNLLGTALNDNPRPSWLTIYNSFNRELKKHDVKAALHEDKRWLEFFMGRDSRYCLMLMAQKGDPIDKYFMNFFRRSKDKYGKEPWRVAEKLLDIENPQAGEFIVMLAENGYVYRWGDADYRDVLPRLDKKYYDRLKKAADHLVKTKQKSDYGQDRERFQAYVNSLTGN